MLTAQAVASMLGISARAVISHERLVYLLRYEPESGHFYRRVDFNNRARAGERAGYISVRNYNEIKLDKKTYRCARLAVFYMTGSWPVDEVDHIDTDSLNDKWSNLREATRLINNRNKHRVRRDSTTGFQGVSRARGKWRAAISVNGLQRHLGVFTTPEAAHSAYLTAKAEVLGANR